MTTTPTLPDDPEGVERLGPEATGSALLPVPLDLPRGPMGLWGALANVAVPSISARELPLADTARFGSGATPFDYDPLLAVDLDVDGLPGPDPVAG